MCFWFDHLATSCSANRASLLYSALHHCHKHSAKCLFFLHRTIKQCPKQHFASPSYLLPTFKFRLTSEQHFHQILRPFHVLITYMNLSRPCSHLICHTIKVLYTYLKTVRSFDLPGEEPSSNWFHLQSLRLAGPFLWTKLLLDEVYFI